MPTCAANGIDVYYEWHGPEGAPVLVLNNGILMTTASWARQVPAFSRAYRVLTYDMRGQGRSSHPSSSYSMALHAEDLAALLDGLQVGRAHVLGISYGGEVAQAFALEFPSRIASLVLCDTVSEVGPELRLGIESWRRACQAGDAESLFYASVSWNFTPEFIAAHGPLLEDARRRYADLDLAAVGRLAEAFFGVDFTERLGTIAVPTCVLVGERDLLKGRGYSEIIHRAIPGAELHVVAGAGHAACWERAEEFNTVVLGFLAKHA